jgi:RimJ/RimL family protein N-acetyltransferase
MVLIGDSPAHRPERITIEGRYATIAPLDPASHGEDLFEATRGPEGDVLWRFLFDGPFPDRQSFFDSLCVKARTEDPLFFAILDAETRQARGYASLMRIEPRHRVIEVGSIMYTSRLQKTRAATEAMYLLAGYVFDVLGYRRYEWKCDALNEPSRRAALRLGFTFEGVFRQHMIVKGRNRDTAWFSMLDSEWPARKKRFERWLSGDNFDQNGKQKTPLTSISQA